MTKRIRQFCSAFCLLGITMPSGVLANPVELLFEETTDFVAEKDDRAEKECQLAYLNGDFRLAPVSMKAAEPIGTLVLYVSDKAGKIVKDAQVITTIIDERGNQQTAKAQSYKYGYMVEIDQLSTGTYRVETEIVTAGQLFTEEFMFIKA